MKRGTDTNLILGKLISDCGFSARTTKILLNAGIENVGDLLKNKSLDLLQLRNAGKKLITEVTDFLNENNLKLKI